MKPKTERILNNSLTDLVAGVKVASMLTGGSDLANYGTIAYNNNYSLLTLNRVLLTYLYTSSGIIQTAIDLPTQDALSKGIEIESGQMSSEEIDQVLDYMEESGMWEAFRNAWNWSRLYGGAALVINSNQDQKEPIDYKGLKRTPLEFYDVDRWQFDNASAYTGDYENYFLYGDQNDLYYLYGMPIHESRVIRMRGKRAPYYVRRKLRGWGMSETDRMIPPLNLYLKTNNVLYEILDESKVDIYKIKGFAQKLINSGGTEKITQRIQLANELKNYVNALVMDMEDEYDQKQMSFGGLAEIGNENRIGIAAALRMPITKLFGLSASGFNTGESDLENYNMMIESECRTPMKPVIRKMIEITMYHLFGRVAPFQIKFPSLRVLSAEQEQTVKDSQFNRTMALYDRGLLDSEEVGQILRRDDIINIETKAEQGLLPPQPEAPNAGENIQDNIQVRQNSAENSCDKIKVKRKIKQNAKFVEEEHPRDEGGKFTSGGGDDGKVESKKSNLSEKQQKQTATKEFKNWFGDSQVVDENGDPLIVYHGSNKEFDSFKQERGGIYFAESDRISEQYGNVGEFYLKSENHIDLTSDESEDILNEIENELWDEEEKEEELIGPDGQESLFELVKWGNLIFTGRDNQNRVMEALRRKGYTGVKMIDFHGGEGEEAVNIVFDPKNIKSATDNSGNFDSEDPSLNNSITKIKVHLKKCN